MIKFNQNKLLGLALCGILSGLTLQRSAKAASTTFTFESVPGTETRYNQPGALTTLTTTSGGQSLTLTRNGGLRFDVEDNTTSGFTIPASFGAKLIDPFFDISTPTGYLIGDLSSSASSVSVQFGDSDGDDDLLTLTGYSGLDGTGTALATTTVDYPLANNLFSANGNIGTATVAGTGIKSFTLSSVGNPGNGPLNYNSLFYDNITVTSVPEPIGLAGLATAAVFLSRKRRSM